MMKSKDYCEIFSLKFNKMDSFKIFSDTFQEEFWKQLFSRASQDFLNEFECNIFSRLKNNYIASALPLLLHFL